MEQDRCLREKDGLTHVHEGGRGRQRLIKMVEKKIGAEIERGENNKRR